MNYKRTAAAFALGAATVLAGAFPALAQNLPETKFHVIGSASNSTIFKQIEKPFWTEVVPQDSNGKVTADLTAHTESGLKGPEIVRLLSSGALDVAFGEFGAVAGDEPSFEGLVLSGVITDFDTLHKASDAYKPVLDKEFAAHGLKLTALLPFPEFAFFCRGEVTSLDDIAGKKVRVYTKSMSQAIEALGGVPTNVPFGEVIPALQTGVVDCAITSTYAGNTAGWAEVTDSLFTLPMGSGISFYAFNRKTWEKLDPALQAFLEKEFAKFEADVWTATAKQGQEGIDCNTGQGECVNGKPTDMVLHKPSEADYQKVKKLAQEVVLPSWAERCGADCVAEWNETVGKVLGITAGGKS
jgi:TRAP-type C4-dicarboxylate transport system substrate-binding protein